MQDASLLDELTAILGSGRFKTLLKHLRTYLPSLLVAARQHQRLSPASAVEKDTQQQCCGVEDDESLQCDDLVAEIEQRVTQLENILTRYSSRYDRPVTYSIINEPGIPSAGGCTAALCT
jgi:hypothetical protein